MGAGDDGFVVGGDRAFVVGGEVYMGPRSGSGVTDGGPLGKVGIVHERLRFLDFARNDIWGGSGMTGNGGRG